MASGSSTERRDRDASGRARNARPRDALGRPLPYGSEDAGRQPEGVRRSPDETIIEAQRLLDAGRPFHAHEVFEDAWKLATGADRALWKGLAQVAVGITHLARGNRSGAVALLERGSQAISVFDPISAHGIDIAGLVSWINRQMAALGGSDAAVDLVAAPVPRLRNPT